MWKRRYKKEKEKNDRHKGKREKLELELACWRPGETVNFEEQIKFVNIMVPSTPYLSLQMTAAFATRVAVMTGLMVGAIIAIIRAGTRVSLSTAAWKGWVN